MADGPTFDPSLLERKDRAELVTIVESLGGKVPARAKKADIVGQILTLVGHDEAEGDADEPDEDEAAVESHDDADETDHDADDDAAGRAGEPDDDAADAAGDEPGADLRSGAAGGRRGGGRAGSPDQGRADQSTTGGGQGPRGRDQHGQDQPGQDQPGEGQDQPGRGGEGQQGGQGDDVESGNRRRRRRGRDRDRRSEQDDVVLAEPVDVEGFVDLREEGYGFLRVNGYLPSRDDAYVSVKQVRQFGLRRGDVVKGRSRMANRNEKNPALLQIDEVNGAPAQMDPPERPDFDDLTPLFPDERLTLEQTEYPENITARIIDLVAPIGKGQRGLIVSPPKAGKTTVMKDIVRAIERNHPDVHVIVLLVDERPEEVTDMKRWLLNGEVIGLHLRPPRRGAHHARRAGHRAGQAPGRAGPRRGGAPRRHHPPGAGLQPGRARHRPRDGRRHRRRRPLPAQEVLRRGPQHRGRRLADHPRHRPGGDRITRMDEVIFEEFKGTGNMELRLDRRLAERRVYPAIDVDASSTRHEELLYDRKHLNHAWKLRRVLGGLKDETGSNAAGLEMLVERLKTIRTNEALLTEIGKA
jgi:transcription termination factor Rho